MWFSWKWTEKKKKWIILPKSETSIKMNHWTIERLNCDENENLCFVIAVVLSTSSGVSVRRGERIVSEIEIERSSVGKEIRQTWITKSRLRIWNQRTGRWIYWGRPSWGCISSCSASDWKCTVRPSIRWWWRLQPLWRWRLQQWRVWRQPWKSLLFRTQDRRAKNCDSL